LQKHFQKTKLLSVVSLVDEKKIYLSLRLILTKIFIILLTIMPQHIDKSIMTHMICAYPNIQKSRDIYNILARYSDYIEVQFPFSDPIADGPLILNACHEVLKTNINTSNCFDALKLYISENMYNPRTLIMTYYQVIYHY